MTIEKLESEAMQIPSMDRLRLAEKLLASLDAPNQQELDDAWRKEVEDRISAYERGEINAHDSEMVHRSIEKHLGVCD